MHIIHVLNNNRILKVCLICHIGKAFPGSPHGPVLFGGSKVGLIIQKRIARATVAQLAHGGFLQSGTTVIQDSVPVPCINKLQGASHQCIN